MADRTFSDKDDTQFHELGQGASLPFMIGSSDSAPGVQAHIAVRRKMPREPTVRVTGSALSAAVGNRILWLFA
jgi:hypothetical protein